MRLKNILQFSSNSCLDSWKTREVAIWYQSVRKSVLVAMLVSCSLRLLGQVMAEESKRHNCFAAITFLSLLYSFFVLFVEFQTDRAQKVQIMIFLNIVQIYFLSLNGLLYQECAVIWSVASSIVFGLYEIPSFQEKWISFLLLARQFVMWYSYSCASTGVTCEIPYILVGSTLWMMYIASEQINDRSKEYYTFWSSLESQEAKLKSILQAIPEGLLVVTAKKELPCFNARLQYILQTENPQKEALQRLHCMRHVESEETMDTSVWQQITEFLEEANQNELETFGVTLITGSYYEWKGTKCHWGASTACILSVSDISTWVSDQRALQQESASKTALLRFVSHELRTPANAILNLVQKVMTEGNLHNEQKEELKIVLTSTYLLLSVVNDLLDFTRILADQFNLVKQSFDVRKTIREAVSLVEQQCVQKGLSLNVKFDDFIPDLIVSDQNRLKQVLLNLLGNAVRFTFQGSIRVICLITDRNTLKISIKDTGIGIPDARAAHLLQTFSTSHNINPQGCGLGLYISNLLAVSLGSQPIQIRSKVGIGSEFSFEMTIYQHEIQNDLSVMETNDTEIEDEREVECCVLSTDICGGKGTTPGESPSVLIVDDIEFNRLVLQKMLNSLGIRADEAYSGLRAVTRVRAAARRGHFYRLILMDVEMPEMDGITATSQIREMESSGELLSRTKIVACSAHRGREDVERCLSAGMDGYIEKPVNRLQLQEIIEM